MSGWAGYDHSFVITLQYLHTDTDIVFIIAAMNAPPGPPPGLHGPVAAIKPSDPVTRQARLCFTLTLTLLLLMTGLMIFNIASLEVSPHQPHPSLYSELPGNYHHQSSSSHTSDVSLLLSFVNISVSPQLTLFLSVTLDSKSFYL